jgi:hypothetical protein
MDARRGLAWVVVVLSAVVGCESDKLPTPVAAPVGGAGKAGGAAGSSGASGSIAVGGSGGARAAAGGTGTAGASGAGGGAALAESETDYAKPENWLCRPGHNGPCEVNLDSTIVKADGSTEVERFQANADAPVDCFYVYPTVSVDATPNSDLEPGPEETSVVKAQFARFASQCRLFAPMYRQVTLTSLRASIGGMPTMPDRTLGYRDVLKAWRYYLEHDNQGRGVVLVGHSQGSSVLNQLIRENLDTKPLDQRFIAAFVIGMNVLVPKDAVVGGTFQNVPLCKSADELGCVLAFSSFRSNTPPSMTTMFSRSTDPNLVAGCTNPAALGGGSAELRSYLTASGMTQSSAPIPPWVNPEKAIDTPFVSVPGLLTAECLPGNSGSYLSITVHGDPADARVDDIVGDVVTNGMVQADWGLHLVDMHMTMGNLVDLVKSKAAAYAKK